MSRHLPSGPSRTPLSRAVRWETEKNGAAMAQIAAFLLRGPGEHELVADTIEHFYQTSTFVDVAGDTGRTQAIRGLRDFRARSLAQERNPRVGAAIVDANRTTETDDANAYTISQVARRIASSHEAATGVDAFVRLRVLADMMRAAIPAALIEQRSSEIAKDIARRGEASWFYVD